MLRLVSLLSLLVPMLAGAQTLLTGTTTVVNASSDDQADPHVQCDLAAYTNVVNGLPSIRYFNFTTNVDSAIPGAEWDESFLSDVDGTRISYTNLSLDESGQNILSQIAIFNTATGLTQTVPGGTERRNSSIGGPLVAFEDRSFFTGESEIVVYNLTTNVTSRLTDDFMRDLDPSVTPTGDAVVFQKCQPDGLGCDIYSATQPTPGTFVTGALTGGVGEETNADTNGTIVVYESLQEGERDIAYLPIGGGLANRLEIPGEQRNPSVSENLIAFESEAGDGTFDIFVYDTSSSTLYRVTQTPGAETLNDISVCGPTARLVYATPGVGGDLDVFAFTFNVPEPPRACVPQSPAEACDAPGNRPLLGSLSLTRTTGAPNSTGFGFTATDDDGLICVTNDRATSGRVGSNGTNFIGPSAFKHQVTLIAREIHNLGATNRLDAEIAGERDTGYSVKVYGVDPACDDDDGDGRADPPVLPPPRPPNLVGVPVQVLGDSLTSVGYHLRIVHDENEPLEPAFGALGCGVGTGGLALSALAILGLWLMSRRQRVTARTRR